MTPKAKILRKLLESYEAIGEYRTELLTQKDYYEYQRANVRGVSYDPDKVPTVSPVNRNTALDYDRQLEQINAELSFTRVLLAWTAEQLQAMTDADRTTIMMRYAAKKTIDQMAADIGITAEQMKYKIYTILQKI